MGRAGESRDWGEESVSARRSEGSVGTVELSSFWARDFGTSSSDSGSGTVFSAVCSLLGAGVSPLLNSSRRLRVCREVIGFMSLVASYWGVRAHFGGFGFLCLSSRWGVVSFVCVQ